MNVAKKFRKEEAFTLLKDRGTHIVDIFDAAAAGDFEEVKAYLKSAPELLTMKNKYGRTPLHEACEKGQQRIAELILGHGATVDAEDNYGKTALMLACEYGHEAIAELLLKKGAEADIRDNKGITPMKLAREKKFIDIVALLKKHGGSE
jgi:ankyrin repeat protein